MEALLRQDEAISKLSSEQARRIVEVQICYSGYNIDLQPKSALMGYQLMASDTSGLFERKEAVLISALVAHKIYSTFTGELWQMMLGLGDKGQKIFKAYTCKLMATGKAQKLYGRPCVELLELGGCETMRQVGDMVKAASETSNVLFHSVNQNYPLIDFIYQDGEGTFHAFKAVTGTTHPIDLPKIQDLEQLVGGGEKLNLYYLVPGQRFERFVTSPVNPGNQGILCKIWHVQVPDPNCSE
jgi:hypothetical protein